jgi:hypothetical protein
MMFALAVVIIFTVLAPAVADEQARVALTGHVERVVDIPEVPKVQRPLWLPAEAYTNDDLIGPLIRKHRQGIYPLGEVERNWNKNSKAETYWTGKKYPRARLWAEDAGWPPYYDWFRFYTIGHDDGPRGWYEDIHQRDAKGYKLYRVWLDLRETTP